MNIINFEKLDSTNRYAKQNIDNLADKTIISADFQTDGYGRFARKWIDLGTENIYMTFVLKPSDELAEVYSNLTQYLSVCLCRQLENMNLEPRIKWPNDVLLNGKKVCGILAETVIKGGKLKGIVLGIGVNLNSSEESIQKIDMPATALNLESGQKIDKRKFRQQLIDSFFADYHEFLHKGFCMIKQDYENRSWFKVQNNKNDIQIKVMVFNKIKEGAFKGFDSKGNLLLLASNAKLEHINMGEIILER